MSTPIKTRSLGEGNVTIKLDSQELVLKPNLNAIQTLSRKYGGLQTVIDRIGRVEFDILVEVISLGLQRNSTPAQLQQLAESIYESGLTDDTSRVPSLCIDYIVSLMRGGKAKPAANEEEQAGN